MLAFRRRIASCVVRESRARWASSSSSSSSAAATTAAADASANEKVAQEGLVEYEGSFSRPIKLLKRVSVFTCGCTLLTMPAMVFAGNETMELAQRLAVTGTVSTFALGTTAALHLFTRSYVHRIVERANGALDIETLNLLALPKITTVKGGIDDVAGPKDSAMNTFRIKSTGEQFFAHGDDSYEFKSTDFYDRFVEKITQKESK